MKSLLATTSRFALLAAAVAGLAAAASAQNLLTNGSFDTGNAGIISSVLASPNTTAIPGWMTYTTGASSNMGFLSADPSPVDGSAYLVINAADSTPGVMNLFQDFSTISGATYTVSFSAGSNGPGNYFSEGAGVSGILAQVYNVVGGATSGSALNSASSVRAIDGPFMDSAFNAPTSFTFVATGSTTRLLFGDVSTVTSSVDAILDNASVSLSSVPEPSTYAAIAGSAVLGFVIWQRRKKPAAVTAA